MSRLVDSRNVSAMSDAESSLAAVVGRNCKRIRNELGMTQSELAVSARHFGLRWRASVVADFESGRSSPTFATVLTLTLTLQRAALDRGSTQGVSLVDLVSVEHDGLVELTGALQVWGSELAGLCNGEVVTIGPGLGEYSPEPPAGTLTPQDQRLLFVHALAGGMEIEEELGVTFEDMQAAGVEPQQLAAMLQRSSVTEDRLVSQLRVKPAELALASFRLWQRNFSEERDLRAGPDANQQKKGRISRELRAELESELSHGDD